MYIKATRKGLKEREGKKAKSRQILITLIVFLSDLKLDYNKDHRFTLTKRVVA